VQGSPAIASRPVRPPIGSWTGSAADLCPDPATAARALRRVGLGVFAVDGDDGRVILASGGRAQIDAVGSSAPGNARPLRAHAPALGPRDLGDPQLRADWGARYGLMAGSMAGGIASVELVEAMARAGMLAFYGAAGLPVATVDAAIERLQTRLLDRPFGCNLIHSPYEPLLERDVAALYVRRGIRCVEASAYLDLSLPLVRYRLHGIRRDPSGEVVTPHRVIAKASRVEVARKLFAPPPAALVEQLVAEGALDREQAAMAATIPIAQDLTAECDSGGHTDNQSPWTLLPTFLGLRDRMQREHGFARPLRVGVAGGISTPASVAAAFDMGAAYVATGSINQATLEAGTSDHVRKLLAAAEQADTTMAPAADMFEMGVQLQVLRRGTLFPGRARKLWELYRAHPGLDALPPAIRQELEATTFRTSLADIRAQTREYWDARDSSQMDRASRDPKHEMALCFRWYLGQSSRWANRGEPGREADYQIWCGPAMGAFNAWTRGSFLEDWSNRRVVVVNLNLLHAASVLVRARILAAQGVHVHPSVVDTRPRPLAALEELSL
jgi:trans-AT polyketide synthase, acyltransferase and oxidoreductase domains